MMLKRLSTDKLTALLALPATGQEQDWEIELADKHRIGEFITAYEELPLSVDDKSALMALILASADQYIETESRMTDEWGKIVKLLAADRELHQEAFTYWRCDDDDDPEAWFPLTPHVRALETSR